MVPDSTLLTDLVSYWKLDEASGTRYDSVLTSANDLTDNNTTGSDTGKQGNAASFVAANSEILSIVDASSLTLVENDYTLLAWFKGSGAFQSVMASWHHGNDFNYQITLDGSSQPYFRDKNSGWPGAVATWGTPTNDGAWHLVIGWLDKTEQKVYIQVDNGSPVSAARTATPAAAPVPFGIGADSGGTGEVGAQAFDGLIDEVAIWSRVLTADERTALYNSGDGVTHPFTGISLP